MKEKINVLIVEDKSLVAESIAAKLRAHHFNVIGIVNAGEEAIDMVSGNETDLVLMDIELKGQMDGITAAQNIRKKLPIPIIYLTDFTDAETFERAKKTGPANFLSKPFNEVDLIRAIELAASNAALGLQPGKHADFEDTVFVRTFNQGYIKIPVRDVLYLRADRAYCDLVTKDKTYKLSNSMSTIIEGIRHPDFMKVHRSYVINLRKIESIVGRFVIIEKERIPISREQFQQIMYHVKLLK